MDYNIKCHNEVVEQDLLRLKKLGYSYRVLKTCKTLAFAKMLSPVSYQIVLDYYQNKF